jgi:hypothetical protein
MKADKSFKEFPIIIESKAMPIHAWLTHPETVLSQWHLDSKAGA